jgi:hypothetical protein
LDRDGGACLRWHDNIVHPIDNGTSRLGPGLIVNSTVYDFQSAFPTKLGVATGQSVVPERGICAFFGFAAAGYAVIRRRRRNAA